MRTLAERLRAARMALGLSQAQAAVKTGMSLPDLADIERGDREVSDAELGRFAALYGRPTPWLTGTSEDSDELPEARLTLAQAYERAARNVTLAGSGLGIWAGRGDWQSVSQKGRDEAGARALDELDEAVTDLLAIRDRIAITMGRAHRSVPGVTDATLRELIVRVTDENEPVSPSEVSARITQLGAAGATSLVIRLALDDFTRDGSFVRLQPNLYARATPGTDGTSPR
ncbi:helix-turn-helix transcriptional regulator [Saccharothrix xinjiangensis]|uniref:Helix-turn-helix domain-containing protein n=1 Tax=Saccharothrix xinjiangensis TaxID=204798 RepID=A0ABV9XWG2_9PSEU